MDSTHAPSHHLCDAPSTLPVFQAASDLNGLIPAAICAAKDQMGSSVPVSNESGQLANVQHWREIVRYRAAESDPQQPQKSISGRLSNFPGFSFATDGGCGSRDCARSLLSRPARNKTPPSLTTDRDTHNDTSSRHLPQVLPDTDTGIAFGKGSGVRAFERPPDAASFRGRFRHAINHRQISPSGPFLEPHGARVRARHLDRDLHARQWAIGSGQAPTPKSPKGHHPGRDQGRHQEVGSSGRGQAHQCGHLQ